MAHQTLASSGKRVIILGGGLSGLCFAHYLRNFLAYHKKTHLVKKILLFEANDYMGGSIKSHIYDDNVVHELGPRSVRTIGPKAQNSIVLMEQLGLSDRIVTLNPKSSPGKDRYVYRDGKFWAVPSSPLQMFMTLPASKERLISVAMKDWRNKKPVDLSQYPFEDPPLYEYMKQRFGPEAVEAVLDPLLRGITAGDCRKWSTRGIFSEVLDKEQAHGGILRALTKPPVKMIERDDLLVEDCLQSDLLKNLNKEQASSYNLKTGLQTVPEHLSNSLLNSNDDNVVAIYNRTKAINVEFSDEMVEDNAPCTVVVETIDGDQIDIKGDHLIAAIPAKDLTQLLNSSETKKTASSALVAPQGPLEYLSKIEQAPVGCVCVEYRGFPSKMPDIMNSFGFLTHSKSGSKLLGISFDSAIFPEIDRGTGAFRMTCMMGGDWYEEVFGTSNMDNVTNAQLEQMALESIRDLLKISDEPHRMSAILWKSGIAQYRPGHVSRLEQTRKNIQQARLPITLIGQSYDGVAINDAIYSARLAADKFVKSL